MSGDGRRDGRERLTINTSRKRERPDRKMNDSASIRRLNSDTIG